MIQQIAYQNFRRGNGNLVFGPGVNIIRGKNEVGKSTVKEHINFSLWGTDSSGQKNPDHLITAGADTTTTSLKTDKFTLSRRKKRGSTSAIKLELDNGTPITLTQTEFATQMRFSFDSFTSIWQVGYFMQLPNPKKMAVLGEIASLNRLELLKANLPAGTPLPDGLKLVNCKLDADNIAQKRRQVQNQATNHEGQLTQINSQIAALAGGTDVDVESTQAHLNAVNAKITALNDYSKAANNYNVALTTFNLKTAAKATAQTDLNAQNKLLAEIREIAETIRTVDLPNYEGKIAEANAEIEALNDMIKPAPTAPINPDLGDVTTCLHCHQAVTEEYKTKMIAEYNEKLIAYNKEAREVEDYNKGISAQLQTIRNILNDYTAKKAKAEAEHENLRERAEGTKNMKGIKTRITELEAAIAEVLVAPVAPIKPEGDLELLDKERVDAETSIRMTNERKTELEKYYAEKANYEASIQQANEYAKLYEMVEGVVRRLPEIETAAILETLTIQGCSARLEEGEFVLVSDMHGGIPYQALSDGRKMKTDLAICKSLHDAALARGKRPPDWVFMDNADLVDDYMSILPQGIQILIAKVDPNQEEVVVDQM